MRENNDYHMPVLLEEILDLLVCNENGIYIDGTLGGGGHFRAMAEKLSTTAILIGIDRDPEAVRWNRDRMPPCGPTTVIIEQAKFSDFDLVLKRNSIFSVDGILLDLGVSSHQIDEAARGFSYMQEAPLDMRMDPSSGVPAHELISRSGQDELASVLQEYGEVEGAGRVAHAIKKWAAEGHPLKTSADLRACCAAMFNNRLSIKLLAKIFQALRIAVNDELGELRLFLEKVLDYLRPGGRLAIVSYHSLEDRMVKEFMRKNERTCTCPPEVLRCVCNRAPIFKRLAKKAIRSSGAELSHNKRSRSARLRVVLRTEAPR
jgi:16S rRNA (cytosine1402-N4)-methyltransferase